MQARDVVAPDFWKLVEGNDILRAKPKENAEQAEIQFRTEAFNMFHGHFRLYLVNILHHLLGTVVAGGHDYLESDLFMVDTLENIMKDRREDIVELALRESWTRRKQQEEILKSELIMKLVQCGMVDVMSYPSIWCTVGTNSRATCPAERSIATMRGRSSPVASAG